MSAFLSILCKGLRVTPAFQADEIALPLVVTDCDACPADKSIFRAEQDTLTVGLMLAAILRDHLG